MRHCWLTIGGLSSCRLSCCSSLGLTNTVNLIASLKKCYTFACVNQHWTCKWIPSMPRCLFRSFIVISVLILYFSLFACDLTSLLIMESWWPRSNKSFLVFYTPLLWQISTDQIIYLLNLLCHGCYIPDHGC